MTTSSTSAQKRKRNDELAAAAALMRQQEAGSDGDEHAQPSDIDEDRGDAHEQFSDSALAGPSRPSRPDKAEPKRKKKDGPSPGIVYISRIPPGMTPQKVKHLMERWGEVGRIYAQKRDPAVGKAKPKHEKANYSEAWVEFLDKKMAKTVAEMLNAQMIGGKKGDRWRDDIWTMKYLSGFKWEMLGEQVAYERQAHTARLRQSLSQSKTEQAEYLRNVELARVIEKRKAKRAEKEGSQEQSRARRRGGGEREAEVGEQAKAKRTYKQRKLLSQDEPQISVL